MSKLHGPYCVTLIVRAKVPAIFDNLCHSKFLFYLINHISLLEITAYDPRSSKKYSPCWCWQLHWRYIAGSLAVFLTVGFCGGFTTFSTFSKEVLAMLQQGNFWSFAAYVAVSVIFGILFVAAGYYAVAYENIS